MKSSKLELESGEYWVNNVKYIFQVEIYSSHKDFCTSFGRNKVSIVFIYLF